MTLDDVEDLPPVIRLLLDEIGPLTDIDEAISRLKSMLPELTDQARSEESERLASEPIPYSTSFNIFLDGSLDLFGHGSCTHLECRLEQARRISRSMGLIADKVFVTDHFTRALYHFGRPTMRKLLGVITDVLVLRTLQPLIIAGIVKFRPGFRKLCPDCYSEFDQQVDQIASSLMGKWGSQATVRRHSNGAYELDTGPFYDPTIVWQGSTRKKVAPTNDEIIHREIKNAVERTLVTGQDALQGGGAIFSNCQVGLAGLLHAEGRLPKGELRVLDARRQATIPWVTHLQPSQIVQLRQEASKALPQFREYMAKHLSATEQPDDELPNPTEVMTEMRQLAAETRSELESIGANSSRFWKATYGMLGLGLSAYGVGSDQVLPALSGILPVLHLLVTHETGHEKELDKAKRRPGYVLVKAQDLLNHAHNK